MVCVSSQEVQLLRISWKSLARPTRVGYIFASRLDWPAAFAEVDGFTSLSALPLARIATRGRAAEDGARYYFADSDNNRIVRYVVVVN